MKFLLIQFAAWTLLAAPPLQLSQGPEVQAALDHISADSMRGNLSFLSSDALEGRDTPSRGLDIAAEFIASQFRRAGLEAAVGDSYFQTADFVQLTRRTEGASLRIEHAEAGNKPEELVIDSAELTVRSVVGLNLDGIPIYKLPESAKADSLPDGLAGKAVLLSGRAGGALLRALRQKKIALVVTRGNDRQDGPRSPRQLVAAELADSPSTPVVSVRNDAAARTFESLPDGPTTATLTLHTPAPLRESVKLRNVIGVLRGSDPQLKDTYIIVTAHYDHLGIKAPDATSGQNEKEDLIYNGANDDGSGVVSVIELAGAMSSMHPRPRRSIVFMTVFGEEKGLLGSQYYSRHPIFPLDHTVANINIEQVGRTDDNQEAQVAAATLTGFTYSDLPQLFSSAGKAVGVNVHDRNPGDDPYFARSDNQALADAGIPSHTVAVALEFPDYHGVGDEWYKIDYTNMTLIDRMLGLGILSLANDSESPKWNESNQNTVKYRTAWSRLHPGSKN
jgi:hypothetical protein